VSNVCRGRACGSGTAAGEPCCLILVQGECRGCQPASSVQSASEEQLALWRNDRERTWPSAMGAGTGSQAALWRKGLGFARSAPGRLRLAPCSPPCGTGWRTRPTGRCPSQSARQQMQTNLTNADVLMPSHPTSASWCRCSCNRQAHAQTASGQLLLAVKQTAEGTSIHEGRCTQQYSVQGLRSHFFQRELRHVQVGVVAAAPARVGGGVVGVLARAPADGRSAAVPVQACFWWLPQAWLLRSTDSQPTGCLHWSGSQPAGSSTPCALPSPWTRSDGVWR
jgi:hypothetical protein